MKAQDLEKFLHFLDRNGVWLFTINHAAVYFRHESRHTLQIALSRHVKAERIVRIARGLYGHHYARSAPGYKRESLIPYLRPGEFSYISLESRLSVLGIISQVPMVLTVMTTGRSGYFETPYGDIEFTHTDRRVEDLERDTYPDDNTGSHLASVRRAYEDLRKVNRNLGLIDEEEYRDALQEELEDYFSDS
jgi:hypothetical protein